MTSHPQTFDFESMAGLVHDLRNHIQIATSAVTILSRHEQVVGSHNLRAIVSQAAMSLERASQIARQPRHGRDAGEDDVNLDQCLADLAPMLRHAIGPSVKIRLHIGRLPKLRCSQLGLENALLNLALNARDAMPGGGTLTITALLAEGPERAEVELVVRDTGRGMPAAVLARALEPHFSTKPDADGHGMGLPSVQGFAEGCGGRLLIVSKQGAGTAVTLRLPLP